MIQEKHLVPGRVLRYLATYQINTPDGPANRQAWIPCMIISFIPDVKRRHERANAKRSGWDILVFWLDERRPKRLEHIYVQSDNTNWKVGW